MRVRPRKALGQHFLTDVRLLAQIAEASEAGPDDVVLEIGPGMGGLTHALLERGATVVAVERDTRMAPGLIEKFRNQPFVLVEGDALTLDWAALVRPWTDTGKRWRVVGNIPYFITSPLLERALTPPLPASVTFLVQKEVADRIIAAPDTEDYGALTVGVRVAATAQRAFVVGRGAFRPPPKVDSAVLHLVPREQALIPPERILPLRRLVVSLFSFRRKRMARALREARGVGAEEALSVLSAAGIDPAVRPETVSPEQFVRLLDVLVSGSGS